MNELIAPIRTAAIMRALIVEDDSVVADVLVRGLVAAGFAADIVQSAEHAISAISSEGFDLLILDLGLPKMGGLELVQKLRREGQYLPILILTARDEMRDMVDGLNLGADDYMTKPFGLEELLARCHALVRRGKAAVGALLEFGPLVLHRAGRTAKLRGRRIDLTAREWAVLEYLLLHSEFILSKDRLMQAVGSWESDISPNAIEVYISRLRAKLEPGGICIRTVRGLGYRIEHSSE